MKIFIKKKNWSAQTFFLANTASNTAEQPFIPDLHRIVRWLAHTGERECVQVMGKYSTILHKELKYLRFWVGEMY